MSDVPLPKNSTSVEKWADALVRYLNDKDIDSSAATRATPPIGTQVKYPNTTIFPKGWLKCDGASYTTARYPQLALVLSAGGASFNVPNVVGEMTRADSVKRGY